MLAWMAEKIELLPVPERSGFKGSVVAVSLLFGLIAAPEVVVSAMQPDGLLIEHHPRVTHLVFPGGRGGGDPQCFLDVSEGEMGFGVH